MSRCAAAAALLLLTATTASAQVLDDDLEFENHVATIELDEDSPVLEGVGLPMSTSRPGHSETDPKTRFDCCTTEITSPPTAPEIVTTAKPGQSPTSVTRECL